MDKKNKICWWLLILFLVLNLVFIGVWVNHTAAEKEEMPVVVNEKKEVKYEKKYGKYLIKKLGMDSLQARKFYELKKKHSLEMRATVKHIDSLRVLLGKEVFSENQDSARVAELIKEITDQKMMFEWENINHLKNIKSILTEEQRIVFDNIHKNMLNKMKQHGSGPRYKGRQNN